MFDVEAFVEACRAARREDATHRAVREVMERSFREPEAVLAGVGVPARAGVDTLHHSQELTVLNVIWGPMMTIMPHDHQMWALIGIYTGREDNIFWRRLPDHPEGRVEAAGARSLGPGEVVPLGRDIVHSVTNPLPRLTGAIHVYGGDFFGAPRSEWEPERLSQRRYDVEKNMRLFEQSNRDLGASA
jgi:predicted metal-dependent enzyme (double-stranded beta helix superfamily)